MAWQRRLLLPWWQLSCKRLVVPSLSAHFHIRSGALGPKAAYRQKHVLGEEPKQGNKGSNLIEHRWWLCNRPPSWVSSSTGRTPPRPALSFCLLVCCTMQFRALWEGAPEDPASAKALNSVTAVLEAVRNLQVLLSCSRVDPLPTVTGHGFQANLTWLSELPLLVTDSPHLWSPRAFLPTQQVLRMGWSWVPSVLTVHRPLRTSLSPSAQILSPRAFSSSKTMALSSQALRPWTSPLFISHPSFVSKPCGHYLPKTVRIQPLLITSTATTLCPRCHHLSPRQHAKHPPTWGFYMLLALSTGISPPSRSLLQHHLLSETFLSPQVPLPIPSPPLHLCALFFSTIVTPFFYVLYILLFIHSLSPNLPPTHIRLLSSRRAGVFTLFTAISPVPKLGLEYSRCSMKINEWAAFGPDVMSYLFYQFQ